MSSAAPAQITYMMSVISAAVTPVVLISALAIFFSALTTKYGHLSDQIRAIAAELRTPGASEIRVTALRMQLGVFKRRMDALWLANWLLSISLLLFISTVLIVIFSRQHVEVAFAGVICLVLGLLLMLAAVITECLEIALGRRSIAYELLDVESSKPDRKSSE